MTAWLQGLPLLVGLGLWALLCLLLLGVGAWLTRPGGLCA